MDTHRSGYLEIDEFVSFIRCVWLDWLHQLFPGSVFLTFNWHANC